MDPTSRSLATGGLLRNCSPYRITHLGRRPLGAAAQSFGPSGRTSRCQRAPSHAPGYCQGAGPAHAAVPMLSIKTCPQRVGARRGHHCKPGYVARCVNFAIAPGWLSCSRSNHFSWVPSTPAS